MITDNLAAQDAMRRHTIEATMAILVATAFHAIATGNMLPAFVTEPDGIAAGASDDLRRFVGVRREQAEGSRNPPGVRGGYERAGFHAHIRACMSSEMLRARGG